MIVKSSLLNLTSTQKRYWILLIFAAWINLFLLSQPANAQNFEKLNREVRVAEMQSLRNGRDADAQARLAAAYLSRARAVGDWQDIDRATRTLERAKTIAENHPDIFLTEANVHIYQHQFREALAAAQKMIDLSPTDPRGYAAAGDALLELGNLESAKQQYEHMLAINRNFDSLNRMAKIAQVFRNTDKAMALMQEAIIAIEPGMGYSDLWKWAKVIMASFEMQRNQFDQAAAILQEVLAEDPDYHFALEHLGEIYAFSEKYTKADKMYARAFSALPLPAYAIAWANVKRGLGQTALADTLDQVAERALRNQVENGRGAYLRELATFYLYRDLNLQDALQFAIQDTTIRKDTGAFETLAWGLQKNGEVEKAWQMIQRTVSRPDANARTFYRAGTIALDCGKEQPAEKYLQKSLKMNSNLSPQETKEARKLLARLHQSKLFF